MKVARLLSAILLLHLFGCASIPEGFVEDGAPLGFVSCEGKPVIYLNANILNTPDEALTLAHEKKHVEQYRRYKSCEEADIAYMRDRINFEAEAFCEEVKMEQLPPYNATEQFARYKYASWLASGGYGPITLDSAYKAIGRYC